MQEKPAETALSQQAAQTLRTLNPFALGDYRGLFEAILQLSA